MFMIWAVLYFQIVQNLTDVVLSEDLSWIQGSTFSNCTSLKSVKIPSDVDTIYSSAFSGCASLESITIPKVLI